MLSDGENAYLYGRGRIGEEGVGGWQYPLGDALGSVRQLTGPASELLLAKAYEPFGSVLSSMGTSSTHYGFAGEWTDGYIKLIYLRSRYYAPESGRFITKDVWPGDFTRPLSLNAWNYVEGNPINYADPSGLCLDVDGDGKCDPGWQCWQINDPAIREICLIKYCVEEESTFLPNYNPYIGPTNLPIPWVYTTDTQRIELSRKVLDWLRYYEGPDKSGRIPAWWKRYADNSCVENLYVYKISAFILEFEPSTLWWLEKENLGGDPHPVSLMARAINEDLASGLRPEKLARYTAFFNPAIRPKSDQEHKLFTSTDWGLWLEGPSQSALREIQLNFKPTNGIRYWWADWEMKCNKDTPKYKYKYNTPPENYVTYFGYREQFEYHCVGQ